MRRIALIGDSIFDNAIYVERNQSVYDILSREFGSSGNVDLLAIDGSITEQVIDQITGLKPDTTHIFVSSGGNDALRVRFILCEVHHTDDNDLVLPGIMYLLEKFRNDYWRLMSMLKRFSCPVTVCTIYDKVPGLTVREKTALSLFNSIILEEAMTAGFDVLDLRFLCPDPGDYSSISPIEPSETGGEKIAGAIKGLVLNQSQLKENHIYTI